MLTSKNTHRAEGRAYRRRMMKRLLLAMLFVGLGLLLAEGVLSEEGGAAGPDVFVRITQPGVNFNAAYLSVAASTSACNPTDVTYVHWDLSEIPTTAFVHNASLTLTANYATGTDGVVLGLYETESGWLEETLTWATSPALGALIETRPAPTTSGQAVTFNSAALRNYLNSKIGSGVGQASFALRFTEGCRLFALARFDDRESGITGPAMYLEYKLYLPDLAIDKSGPATASPGEVIEYTLVYSNTGNGFAPYVTITDVLPPHLTALDHTGTIMLPLPGQTLTWEVFDLAPGEGGVLTITAIVSPTFTGLLTNTATITTTAVESNTTNNTSPPIITEVRAPDLTIHKTGPAIAYQGDVITYTLSYSNTGNTTAPYVTITDLLPLNTQLYDHSGTVLLPSPDRTLTWEVFNLAPGASGTLTVSVAIDLTYTGWLTNTVTIATTTPEVVVDNNMSTVSTQVVSLPVIPRYIYLPLVMRTSP